MKGFLGIDLGRATFAVGLATILYFFALHETEPEQTRDTDFTIPVDVVNRPAALVAVDNPPPVRLRVRASVTVLNRLRLESFSALVDASNARAGDQRLAVNVRWTDPDVREATAIPSVVQLRFEDLEEHTVPVRVSVTGQVPGGYLLGQPTTDPGRVTVSGAASQVRRAYEAVVDVNVDRVTVTVSGTFTPRVTDDRGNELPNLTVRPTSVAVQLSISQQAQFKEVGVRPRISGQPGAGYVLEPVAVNPPTVTLVGDPAALQAVNFVDSQPIDVTGLASTVVRRVGVVPPPNTLLVQQGQTVLATVRVSPLNVTQTLRVQPSVLSLPPGLELARALEAVSITISGPAPTLAGLSGRDFRVVVDVSGHGAGKFDARPLVQNLPQGMTVDKVDPARVSVELREAG